MSSSQRLWRPRTAASVVKWRAVETRAVATRARSRRGGRRDGRAIAHRRNCGRRRRGCAWRERRKDSARHWDPRGTRQRGASRRVVAAGPLWQRAGRTPADPLARLRLNVNQEDATLLGAMASTHLHALHTHRAQLLDWTCRLPSLPAEAGRRVLAALMPLVPLGADFGRHLLLLLRKLLSHLAVYGFCGLLARNLLPSEPGASTSASSHGPEPASRARDGARSAVLVAGHPAAHRRPRALGGRGCVIVDPQPGAWPLIAVDCR